MRWGLGAVEADRLQFLRRLLATTFRQKHQEEDVPAVQTLPPFCLFDNGGQVMQILEGMDKHHAPLNDWINNILRPYAERIIPDNDRYTLVFDKLEILMALSYAHHKGKWSSDMNSLERYWAPSWRFRIPKRKTETHIMREIKESLSKKAR